MRSSGAWLTAILVGVPPVLGRLELLFKVVPLCIIILLVHYDYNWRRLFGVNGGSLAATLREHVGGHFLLGELTATTFRIIFLLRIVHSHRFYLSLELLADLLGTSWTLIDLAIGCHFFG